MANCGKLDDEGRLADRVADDHNEVARMLGAKSGFRKPVMIGAVIEAFS